MEVRLTWNELAFNIPYFITSTFICPEKRCRQCSNTSLPPCGSTLMCKRSSTPQTRRVKTCTMPSKMACQHRLSGWMICEAVMLSGIYTR